MIVNYNKLSEYPSPPPLAYLHKPTDQLIIIRCNNMWIQRYAIYGIIYTLQIYEMWYVGPIQVPRYAQIPPSYNCLHNILQQGHPAANG